MRRASLLLHAVSLVVPLAVSAEGLPLRLGTSGYLLDATDHPLDNPGLALGFSVWSDATSSSAGSRVWPASGESACVVAVANGYYAAVLDGSAGTGCGAGLTSDHLPGTSPRYLQVSVAGVTLTPRTPLASVPTASLATRSADAQALIASLAQGGASVNETGNLVSWKSLKGVPEGLADGVDHDTTYTAAASGGLSLLGQAFSIANGGVTNAMLAQSSITVAAGAGLAGGGAVALGGTTTLALADVPTVTPGAYTNAGLTVDAKGRITAVANGAPTGVTQVIANNGLSGGTITSTGTIGIAAGGVTPAMLALDAAGLARVTNGGMTASDGNIGINRASPSTRLHLGKAVTGAYAGGVIADPGLLIDTGYVGTDGTYGHNGITFAGDADSASFIYQVHNNNADSQLALGTGNTERVRIDSTGAVGIGTSAPAAGAILDLTSSTRAFLPPRLSRTQRDAIPAGSLVAGMVLFNTDDAQLNLYNGSAWTNTAGGTAFIKLGMSQYQGPGYTCNCTIFNGQVIQFDTLKTFNRLSTSSYGINLKAGRTYRLEASVNLYTPAGNQYLGYQFSNGTSGIGDGCYSQWFGSSASAYGFKSICLEIYKPPTDQTVVVKVTDANIGTGLITPNYNTYFMATEL